MSDYREFELRIEPGPTPTSYVVTTPGPDGDVSLTFEEPFPEKDLKIFILTLGKAKTGVRRIESSETALARDFGTRLFETIMAGAIGDAYKAAMKKAAEHGQGLRITLSMTRTPKLAEIPWEYLHDGSDFLATSPETPIVRFLPVDLPHRSFQVELPLRILAVTSSPAGAAPLRSGLERANLELTLKPLLDRGVVELDWLEHATLGQLNNLLRSGTYHIVHFIGHGDFVPTNHEGALLFEDDQGQQAIVGADRLAGVVRSRESIRLIVLNSCEGARGDVDDPFSSVATSLIKRGVPAVIGMQFEISDQAAVTFAKEFYTVLAEGKPVDKAVSESRLAMYAGEDNVEWGTPVLFMRVGDGQLFDVSNAAPISREEIGPAPVPLQPEDLVGVKGAEPGKSWRERLAALSAPVRLGLLGAAAVPAAVVGLVLLSGIAGPGTGGGSPGPSAVAPGGSAAASGAASQPVVVGFADQCHTPGTGAPWILFHSNIDANGVRTASNQLYCINPDNGDIVAITTNEAPSQTTEASTYPKWDAAHRDIVFDRGSGNNQKILVRHPDGSVETVVADGQKDLYPAMASTGLVAFTRDFRDAAQIPAAGNSELRIVMWPAGTLVAAVPGRNFHGPDWRPSDPTLVFFGQRAGQPSYDIGTLTVQLPAQDPPAQIEPTWIEDPSWVPNANQRDPAWSRDGGLLAFMMDQGSGGTGGDNDIWTYDIGSKTSKQLTGLASGGAGVQDNAPAWSPTDSRIAFIRYSNKTDTHIWIMDSDGSNQRDLTPGRPGTSVVTDWN